jgi:hypothetical protein
MLDDKSVRTFGKFIAQEHKFCFTPLNYDSCSYCLLHHKATLFQRFGFFLNVLHLLGYFVFEAVTLSLILLESNLPKTSDILWLSIYALGYLWSFLTVIEVWFLRKDIAYAFNCLVAFSRKLSIGKKDLIFTLKFMWHIFVTFLLSVRMAVYR